MVKQWVHPLIHKNKQPPGRFFIKVPSHKFCCLILFLRFWLEYLGKTSKSSVWQYVIYICCYHRSSVNIAFGVSRSELTKPGDQSMAGFDFINNTIKSGDRSMAGLDPIEVYISKWIIRLWYDFMFSIWFYPNIVIIWCFQYDFTSTLWCIWSSRIK